MISKNITSYINNAFNIKRDYIKKRYNNFLFEKEILKTTKINFVPKKFVITITGKCNLRCPKCQYIILDPNYFDKGSFMRFEKYEEFLFKYAKYSNGMITLTGGEATLHPYLGKFIDISHSYNIKVQLPTNGTLINEKKLHVLRKLDKISVSLDAYDAETYYKNRGGSKWRWKSILKGLKLLRENGVNFYITYQVRRDNIDEMFNIIELSDSIMPGKLVFQAHNPHKDDKNIVLHKSDPYVVDVFKEIMKKNDYQYNITLPIIFDEYNRYFKEKICPDPWRGIYINELGNVSYCCYMDHQEEIGNIYDGYDFNSKKMSQWRRHLMNHKLNKHCKWCGERFMGDQNKFISKKHEWVYGQSMQEVTI